MTARASSFTPIQQLIDDTDGAADIYQAQAGAYTLLTARHAHNGPGLQGRLRGRNEASSSRPRRSRATGASTSTAPRAGRSHCSRERERLEARYDGASTDGSRVFFHSIDSLGDGDGDATTDVYMNLGGTITQISGTGNQSATFAATSTDGSRAFFTTEEDVAGTTDADGVLDAFRYEGGARTLITVNTTQAATFNAISADGSIVFFSTLESLTGGDGDGVSNDIYKRQGTDTTLMSAPDATIHNSNLVDASADGGQIVFSTREPLVGSEDTLTSDDLYRSNGTTRTLLTGTGNADVTFRGASADGSLVFFTTTDVLATGDNDSAVDVYMADGNTISLISTGATTTDAAYNGISLDGSAAFFSTTEAVPGSGDQDTALDVYASRVGGGTPPDPTDPTDPADPTDPTDPTDPANPTIRAIPSTPLRPPPRSARRQSRKRRHRRGRRRLRRSGGLPGSGERDAGGPKHRLEEVGGQDQGL